MLPISHLLWRSRYTARGPLARISAQVLRSPQNLAWFAPSTWPFAKVSDKPAVPVSLKELGSRTLSRCASVTPPAPTVVWVVTS
jgi:hypothetical protein